VTDYRTLAHDLNMLEMQAYVTAGNPTYLRWNQAQIASNAVKAGLSSAVLAAQWIDLDTGFPYEWPHVMTYAHIWDDFDGEDGLPDWDSVYGSYTESRQCV